MGGDTRGSCITCRSARCITCRSARCITCRSARCITCRSDRCITCRSASCITCRSARCITCTSALSGHIGQTHMGRSRSSSPPPHSGPRGKPRPPSLGRTHRRTCQPPEGDMCLRADRADSGTDPELWGL